MQAGAAASAALVPLGLKNTRDRTQLLSLVLSKKKRARVSPLRPSTGHCSPNTLTESTTPKRSDATPKHPLRPHSAGSDARHRRVRRSATFSPRRVLRARPAGAPLRHLSTSHAAGRARTHRRERVAGRGGLLRQARAAVCRAAVSVQAAGCRSVSPRDEDDDLLRQRLWFTALSGARESHAADFKADTDEHGWPSFRAAEVFAENVRVAGGLVTSACGTHLGTYLPDDKGPRWCIDLACVAGHRALNATLSTDKCGGADAKILSDAARRLLQPVETVSRRPAVGRVRRPRLAHAPHETAAPRVLRHEGRVLRRRDGPLRHPAGPVRRALWKTAALGGVFACRGRGDGVGCGLRRLGCVCVCGWLCLCALTFMRIYEAPATPHHFWLPELP